MIYCSNQLSNTNFVYRIQRPVMWTHTLEICIFCFVLATCVGYDLYGCHLPDRPSTSQLLRFQSCVSEANGNSHVEGGRWGRSIAIHRRRQKSQDTGIILRTLQLNDDTQKVLSGDSDMQHTLWETSPEASKSLHVSEQGATFGQYSQPLLRLLKMFTTRRF